LVCKTEGKRPLGRHRRRWDNIKWTTMRQVAWCRLDLSGSRTGLLAGSSGDSNKREIPHSMKK